MAKQTSEPRFDIPGFQNYLKAQFTDVMDSHWAWDLIENLADYAVDSQTDIPDGIVVFLSNMIPELAFEEVAAFTPDEWLSKDGKERKQSFWRKAR